MDLLTTYTHDSELQALHKAFADFHNLQSLHAKYSLVCSVFTSRCLVTALNNEHYSVSLLTSLLSGEYPTTEPST
jgi:hypothetical protein